MKKQKVRLVKINESRHMVITPPLRVSFPQVFEAKAFEEGDDKFFQVDLIADSLDTFKEPYKGKKKKTPSMMKVVTNAKLDQWGEDKAAWPKFAYPVFKKGNERKNEETGEIYDGYKGKFFITAKSGEKFPPKVIDKDGSELTENDFYGGCIARAQLIARPYHYGKNKGVRFILLQLMKVEDGERFGGVADDVFDVEESEEDDSDDFDGDDEEDSDDDF